MYAPLPPPPHTHIHLCPPSHPPHRGAPHTDLPHTRTHQDSDELHHIPDTYQDGHIRPAPPPFLHPHPPPRTSPPPLTRNSGELRRMPDTFPGVMPPARRSAPPVAPASRFFSARRVRCSTADSISRRTRARASLYRVLLNASVRAPYAAWGGSGGGRVQGSGCGLGAVQGAFERLGQGAIRGLGGGGRGQGVGFMVLLNASVRGQCTAGGGGSGCRVQGAGCRVRGEGPRCGLGAIQGALEHLGQGGPGELGFRDGVWGFRGACQADTQPRAALLSAPHSPPPHPPTCSMWPVHAWSPPPPPAPPYLQCG